MQENTETPQQRAIREREAERAAERKAREENRQAELELCADEVAERAILAGCHTGECIRWFVLKLGAAGISPLTIRNAIDAE